MQRLEQSSSFDLEVLQEGPTENHVDEKATTYFLSNLSPWNGG